MASPATKIVEVKKGRSSARLEATVNPDNIKIKVRVKDGAKPQPHPPNAKNRDVPPGQEENYRDRLAQARQGKTPTPDMTGNKSGNEDAKGKEEENQSKPKNQSDSNSDAKGESNNKAPLEENKNQAAANKTGERIKEENNPFTAEAPMDSLGAGGRDVPPGQEDYYRQQLQEQRGGLPATHAGSESASAEPSSSSQSDAGAGGGIDNKAESGKNNQADADPDADKEDWEKKDSISQSSIAQRMMAKRMKALREKRKEQEAKAGVEEEEKEGRIPGLSQYRSARNKYKRIKNIIRIIKLVSAAGSSFGDIFVSAGTFLLTAHGELVYAKYINPEYPIDKWEKWLVYGVDIIILVDLIIVGVMIIIAYQLIDNPEGALQFIS